MSFCVMCGREIPGQSKICAECVQKEIDKEMETKEPKKKVIPKQSLEAEERTRQIIERNKQLREERFKKRSLDKEEPVVAEEEKSIEVEKKEEQKIEGQVKENKVIKSAEVKEKKSEEEELLEGRERRVAVALKELHDYAQPDVVMAVLSSAGDAAFALKEAWKEAYKDEKVPYFMLVDPEPIVRKYLHQSTLTDEESASRYFEARKNIDERLRENFSNKELNDLRLVILDEAIGSFRPPHHADRYVGSFRDFLCHENGHTISGLGYSLEGPGEWFKEYLDSNVAQDLIEYKNVWVCLNNDFGNIFYSSIGKRIYDTETDKKSGVRRFRALHGKKGKERVAFLKAFGRNVGRRMNDADIKEQATTDIKYYQQEDNYKEKEQRKRFKRKRY